MTKIEADLMARLSALEIFVCAALAHYPPLRAFLAAHRGKLDLGATPIVLPASGQPEMQDHWSDEIESAYNRLVELAALE